MFGHDDDKDENITTVNPTLDDGDNTATTPTDDPSVASDSTAAADPDAPVFSEVPTASDNNPVLDSTDNDEPAAADTPVPDDTEDSAPASSSPAAPDHDSDSLLELKKTALEELAPLVDQLDQSAEEKFKTTMMMIQATDDSSLVGAAHEAAKQITDEKVRAQALLDIVNEINYFTQDSAK